MQEEIVNSQCFDFPKMKKQAEGWYRIVDEMTWELFNTKAMPISIMLQKL